MNPTQIHNRFREYKNLQTILGQPLPDIIEIAYFIEDNFGLLLTDDEIIPESIGDLQTAEGFVLQKLKES